MRRLRKTGSRLLCGWGRCLLGLALLSPWLAGCANFWDDVTSRDFHFKTWYEHEDPLVVLRDSKDGDKRARALGELEEPGQKGGSQADQDAVVRILVTAATTEKQPLCRLAAIQTLGKFKDPRAVQGLIDAFYNASAFIPDTTAVIRCQAVTALGETRNPAAIELLVRVVGEPPAEGPDADRQLTLDIRQAAARALGNFTNYQATDALVHVLDTEKDVAMRDRACESLQKVTGQQFPADAKTWREFLAKAPGKKPETGFPPWGPVAGLTRS